MVEGIIKSEKQKTKLMISLYFAGKAEIFSIYDRWYLLKFTNSPLKNITIPYIFDNYLPNDCL